MDASGRKNTFCNRPTEANLGERLALGNASSHREVAALYRGACQEQVPHACQASSRGSLGTLREGQLCHFHKPTGDEQGRGVVTEPEPSAGTTCNRNRVFDRTWWKGQCGRW